MAVCPSAPNKKRVITSDWIITSTEEYKEDVDSSGYKVYETDNVMLVVCEEKTENLILRNEDREGFRKVHKCKSNVNSSSGLENFQSNDPANGCELSTQPSDEESDNPDSDIISCDSDVEKGVSDCENGFIIENDGSELQHTIEDINKHYIMTKNVDPEFYKIENENKFIMHLPFLSNFTIFGKLKVTLLAGEIEVFGYSAKCEDKNKSFCIYSPRRCMQMCIQSKLPSLTLNESRLKTVLEELGMSKSDLKNFFQILQPNDVVLVIEKLICKYSLVLDHYYDDIDMFYTKQVAEKGTFIEKELGCFLNWTDTKERRVFTKGKDWSDIKTKSCTIICGGKGVGKSTLLRYLVNAQLSDVESVLCLDFDLGQTEFTPPGCVSAVLINKPLLGPKFTNIVTPEEMIYPGFLNATLDPFKYMMSVNYIIQKCRNNPEYRSIPWFVNTMGFNKGIGFDFMVNIIRLVEPDLVIQINSSDKSRNYQIHLTPESVLSSKVLSFLPVVKTTLNYDFYLTDSCSRVKGIGFQSGFKPPELRDFMTVSYFSAVACLPYCNLNAAEPHWISLTNLTLAVNKPITPNHVLRAFNGSLVGLCNLDGVECKDRLIAEDSEGTLRIAVQPEAAPCFGIGLVRGVDVKERKIYVLSPLSSIQLLKVNCLYLGKISPPSSIFLKQQYVDRPTVYTDISGTRNIRTLKRIFKYVPQIQNNAEESL